MKVLLVFLSFISNFILKAEPPEEFLSSISKFQTECSETIPIDPKIIHEIRKNPHVDETNEQLTKYLFCMAKKAGLIDKKGFIQYDTVRLMLKEVGVDDAVISNAETHCKTIERTSKIEIYAVRMRNCYYGKIPKEYVVI